MSTYQVCEVCGQYINTETTDHLVDTADGKERFVHIRPCSEKYLADNEDPNMHIVRNHQHRS